MLSTEGMTVTLSREAAERFERLGLRPVCVVFFDESTGVVEFAWLDVTNRQEVLDKLGVQASSEL